MTMRKLITLILVLTMLTACAAENTQSSEVSSETTVAKTTAVTAAREKREYIDVSEDNRFIDFDFIEDYKGDELSDDMKSAAIDCLIESRYYKESVADTEKLRAEKDDEQHAEFKDTYDFERFYDKSGNLVPIISAAYPEDYNGDGTKEAFVLVDIPIYAVKNDLEYLYPTVRSYLVFVSEKSDGYNAEIIDNFSGIDNLALLDYGEFKQLIVGGYGIMGADDHDVIFGVVDGKAATLYGFRGEFKKTGCFLGSYGWQGSGNTMYYDTVRERYVTIGGVPLEWKDVLAIDSTGAMKDYEKNEFYAELIGGKYYCIYMGPMDCGEIYIYENGRFVPSADAAIRHNPDDPECISIDIEKAYAQMLTPTEAKAAASPKGTTTEDKKKELREKIENPPADMCTKLQKQELVNTDGTLTDTFLNRTEELTKYLNGLVEYGAKEPGLFDFDNDGLPEIYFVDNSGAQGAMPCYVYSALDLSFMGEFDGYCRDGFTRFYYSAYEDAAIIHSYFEHSVQLRNEWFYTVTVKNGKLEITETASSGSGLNYGEVYPTLTRTDDAVKPERQKTSYWRNFCREGISICANDHHEWDYKDYAKNIVGLYNTYITLKASADLGKKPEYEFFIFVGKGAYYSNGGEVWFIYPDKKTEKLGISNCNNAYRLWNGITVFQPSLDNAPCEVYRIADGKPHRMEELSGKGQMLDFSPLYNECYSLAHSVYNPAPLVGHTFMDYLFGWDYNSKSTREYGSIKLTPDEFKAIYGKSAQKYIDEIETHADITENDFTDGLVPEKGEITEVLYRTDTMFIINYRIPVMGSDPNIPGDEKRLYAYKYGYIMLKPLIEIGENKDGELLKEVDRGYGNYLTALNPENAVYPEKKPTNTSLD